MYDRDTFIHAGHKFRVRIERDDCMGPPWKEHDGHGIVSEWERRAKLPGERVLIADRHSKRFYDVAASIALAKRDGWGLSISDTALLMIRLGHEPTKAEIAAQAVELDFARLKGWCNDDWEWLQVGVERLDRDGEVIETEWLGGIDGDGPYVEEVAHELAGQLLYEPRKAWLAALAQARARKGWERLCAVLAGPLMGAPA